MCKRSNRTRSKPDTVRETADPATTVTTIPLSALKRDGDFRLSFPLRPGSYHAFTRRFPGLPPLVVTPDNRVVFGHDHLAFLEEDGAQEVTACRGAYTLTSGLVLNYNLKQALDGINLYETLVFLRKMAPVAPLERIRRWVRIPHPVDDTVMDRLEALLDEAFIPALSAGLIDLETARRIVDLPSSDREPMIGLFTTVPFTQSQRRIILDMTEELLAGSQRSTSLRRLFRRLRLNRLETAERPQKKIISALASIRYPHLHAEERSWKDMIAALDIPEHITVKPATAFENRKIEVRAELEDVTALVQLIEKLKKNRS